MKKDKFISFDGTNQTFADIETNTKKLSIFEVYVLMQDQKQCNRMKQICVDNGLKIGSHSKDFEFIIRNGEVNTFRNSLIHGFGIWWLDKDLTQVTETEFLQLLKEYNDEKNI